MPATDTIASSDFFTFVAGTPARATQVNSNFNVFRGTIIPVDPNTSASTTNSFDLGSTTYQWRNIYLQNTPIVNGAAIASSLYIESVFDGANPPDDLAPIADIQRISFETGKDRDVIFNFQVIPNFIPGNQIGLTLYGYHDVTGPSAAIFVGVSSLYKAASTDADTTTALNQNTATITASLVTATGQFFKNDSLTVTDATGLINGVTVTAGDVISINLKRTGTATLDSATGNVILTDIIAEFNV